MPILLFWQVIDFMCSYCLDGIFSVETRILVSQVHPQMLFFLFVKIIFIKPLRFVKAYENISKGRS